MVNNIFSGEYHTQFKGQGMTFADFREYVAGDDVRSISWTLTARAGKPFIKTYEEERELTLMLAVDVSGSQDFGSKNYFKGETLTYVAATLAFSAVKNNDQVGLLLFSDEVELYIPPKKGRAQVYRILRELLYFKPKRQGTKISTALDYLRGVLKKRATIFLLSDFKDGGAPTAKGMPTNYDASMRLLERKHEVIAGLIADEAEFLFPDVGMIELQDSETGEHILLDTSNPSFREEMKAKFKTDFDQFQKVTARSGVRSFSLEPNDEYHKSLLAFFKRKKSR
ncbi:MAG: DUF58 domain-containing protein [Bdellovibrionaceae bacterium]|nr:DUF58 domain-containing protein [Bdellovibrio sp.]